MEPLIGKTKDEYDAIVSSLGEAPYRARQIEKSVNAGRLIDEMSELSLKLRERLKADYTTFALDEKSVLTEEKTDTRKFLLRMQDSVLIECVGMVYDGKLSVCVSTQAGCPMRCVFCESGRNGLIRSLTSPEIISQAYIVSRNMGMPVHSVVLMGSGEPLLNYRNVKEFIEFITREDTLGIGVRRITLSTCGVTSGIKRMTEDGLGVNLSLSLHCAVPEIRKTIMPSEEKFPLSEAYKACMEYRKASGRLITLEYSVIDGVNDSLECARALAELIKGSDCEVNIIDYNPTEGYRGANKANTAGEFAKKLKRLGINYTIRRKLGSSVAAACGQLKSSYEAFSEKK